MRNLAKRLRPSEGSGMGAFKGYIYLVARSAIALTLIVTGAVELLPLIYAAFDQRFMSGWVIFSFAVNAVQAGVGTALLRGRARGLATVLCLGGALIELFGIDLSQHMFLSQLPRLPRESLIRWDGFDPFLIRLFFLPFYASATIFLLLPQPRIPVRNAPAEPDDRLWRKWLLASLQGEGVRPVRDRFMRGALVKTFPVLGAITFMIVLLPVAFLLAIAKVPTLFSGILGTAVLVGMIFVWRGLQGLVARIAPKRYERIELGVARARVQARSAEEELRRSGSRRPVLYLRAFSVDSRSYHEQSIVDILRKIGPVIAIGRPDEEFPPLGAARFYVDNAHWQAKVADIVRVARLVIWVTGTTEGLKWELAHLRQSLAPEKLILWAHPHLLGLTGPAKQAEWTRFLDAVGSILPVPLPRELGEQRFFFFNDRWEPKWFYMQTGRLQGGLLQEGLLRKTLDAQGILKFSPRRMQLRALVGLVFYSILIALFVAVVILRLFHYF
jgi:hypothetical protein